MASSLGGWRNPLQPHGGLSTERWQMPCFHLFLRQMESLVPRIAKAANAEAITPIARYEKSNFCNYDWGIKLTSNFAVHIHSISFSWKFFTNSLWSFVSGIVPANSYSEGRPLVWSIIIFPNFSILHLGLTWFRNNGINKPTGVKMSPQKHNEVGVRMFSPFSWQKHEMSALLPI